MDPITQQAVLATAGAAAGGDKVYVDDVFSTFLYEGSTSTQTITNGIDLSGEGGLVWIKNRDNSRQHSLYDSERPLSRRLSSNKTDGEQTLGASGTLTFNSNGVSIPSGDGDLNGNGFGSQVAWTFRKAPGFFDVVTYTGDGASTRNIAHSLGSVPGFIIVKKRNDTGNWFAYHRSLGANKWLNFHYTDGEQNNYGTWPWNGTTPTSTQFSISGSTPAGDSYDINKLNDTYVAYLFAHDDASFGTGGNESIIKCGAYTGTGSSGNTVDLGFEPQWLLQKRATGTGDWILLDTMRGWDVGGTRNYLEANTSDSEAGPAYIEPTSTGFKVIATGTNWNASGEQYIYMAIRRPHKPPTAGTDVFDDVAYTGNGSTQDISISPSLADSVLIKRRTAGDNWGWANRLAGALQHLTPNSSAQEGTRNAGDAVEFDRMSAFGLVGNSSGEVNISGAPLLSYSFKRAPGFFDIINYSGPGGGGGNIAHNLGVAPELIIFKVRNDTFNWGVWYGDGQKMLLLNTNGAPSDEGFSSVSATNITFSGGNAIYNNSGSLYIAYLFATLPGISKVGSYTGTGNAINVDCGFTAGARFVMIKRTDSTGDWYVWDTARGIVSGNDPYLFLNDSGSEVTNTDYIDPLNSGFTVTSSAPAALNASGGTYIFLAIA